MDSKKVEEMTELVVSDLTASGGDDYWIYFQSEDGLADFKVAKTTLIDYISLYFSSVTAPTYESGITAFAGGGQGSATALTHTNNRIDNAASANASVKVGIAATEGFEQTVQNKAANDIVYYPFSGENFLGEAINAGITISPGNQVTVICYDDGELTFK